MRIWLLLFFFRVDLHLRSSARRLSNYFLFIRESLIMELMNVHGVPFSSCTATVLACLNEKQLNYELIPVNLTEGHHKQSPFLSINVSHIDFFSIFLLQSIVFWFLILYEFIHTCLYSHSICVFPSLLDRYLLSKMNTSPYSVMQI